MFKNIKKIPYLEKFQQCLKHKHEIEFIIYDRKDDYSDGCPAVEVLHCASESEDICITFIYPEDFVKIKKFFKNVTPVIAREQFNGLYDIYEQMTKINTYPSAHSMDTSFYALYNDVLVEFWSSEDGVIPSGYPLRDEVDGNLIQIVRDCQNVPAVQLKIDNLMKEYSTLKLTKDKFLSQQADDILLDFSYYYKRDNREADLPAFLSGKKDEFGNVYFYSLDSRPSAGVPGEVSKSIRLRLPYLPQIDYPESSFLFAPTDIEVMYNDTNPDLQLIENAIIKVTQGNLVRKNKFFKLLREITNKTDASRVIIDFSKVSYRQKAVLGVTWPASMPLLRRSGIVLRSFSPTDWPLDFVAKDKEREMIKYVIKVSPQAVFFVNNTSRIREILQNMSKT